MFGERPNFFSIRSIISGLNRTLNTMNNIIPIYKNSLPIINNAKDTFKKFKNIVNTSANKILENANSNKDILHKKINTMKSVNSKNTPTFFN